MTIVDAIKAGRVVWQAGENDVHLRILCVCRGKLDIFAIGVDRYNVIKFFRLDIPLLKWFTIPTRGDFPTELYLPVLLSYEDKLILLNDKLELDSCVKSIFFFDTVTKIWAKRTFRDPPDFCLCDFTIYQHRLIIFSRPNMEITVLDLVMLTSWHPEQEDQPPKNNGYRKIYEKDNNIFFMPLGYIQCPENIQMRMLTFGINSRYPPWSWTVITIENSYSILPVLDFPPNIVETYAVFIGSWIKNTICETGSEKNIIVAMIIDFKKAEEEKKVKLEMCRVPDSPTELGLPITGITNYGLIMMGFPEHMVLAIKSC